MNIDQISGTIDPPLSLIIVIRGLDEHQLYSARLCRWLKWKGLECKTFVNQIGKWYDYQDIIDWVEQNNDRIAILSTDTDLDPNCCANVTITIELPTSNDGLENPIIKITDRSDPADCSDQRIGINSIKTVIVDDVVQKISQFITNICPKKPKIYATRHGESIGQTQKIIGGNSSLTEKGSKYGPILKQHLDQIFADEPKVTVLCSCLQRSVQTSCAFADDPKYTVRQWSLLNEINGGLFEDLSYEMVEKKHPDIYLNRMKDKYLGSWPEGETYRDMIDRLQPVFMELEHLDHPVVIIAHQAICRGINAYLMDRRPEECIDIEIPSHHMFEFTYHPHGYDVHRYDLTF
jgi:broad specificity phosphatase PhoE